MNECRQCLKAQTQPNHCYVDSCVTCEVRRISSEPQHRRLEYYATIADEEEKTAFITAVALEFRRRKGYQT